MKSWKYNEDIVVFPNTTLNTLELSDCDNTLTGTCIDNISLKDCIKICDNNTKCDAGYHIQLKDNKSLCVPLKTDLYKINMSRRLIPQNTYPEFKDVEVNTFINTNRFPFPNDSANAMYYYDIITIKNIETNTFIGINMENKVEFSKNQNTNITLIPKKHIATEFSKYLPILYGDYFNISISNTSLVIKNNDDNSNNLFWNKTSNTYFYFKIIPNVDKKIGDNVCYGDKFKLIYNDVDNTIVNSKLYILQIDPTIYSTFYAISRMSGYYCEKQKCNQIYIRDMETNGIKGRYNGKIVGLESNCFGLCDFSTLNTPQLSKTYFSKGFGSVFFISILVIVIVIYIISKNK